MRNTTMPAKRAETPRTDSRSLRYRAAITTSLPSVLTKFPRTMTNPKMRRLIATFAPFTAISRGEATGRRQGDGGYEFRPRSPVKTEQPRFDDGPPHGAGLSARESRRGGAGPAASPPVEIGRAPGR